MLASLEWSNVKESRSNAIYFKKYDKGYYMVGFSCCTIWGRQRNERPGVNFQKCHKILNKWMKILHQ